MKKIILLFIFSITFSLFSQTFQVNKIHSLLFMGSMGSLSLFNNYYDRNNTFSLDEAELKKLSSYDVPAFDRIALKPYSHKLKKLSDYTIYITFASTLYYTFDKNEFADNLIVLGEILLVQDVIGKWTKSFCKRKRPFVYNDDVSIETKQLRNSQHSFYSLHSSTAFSLATFTYYYQLKNNDRNYLAVFLLYGSATATAVLRVASANHFPSDVVVGAIVGSTISYLICEYHHKKNISLQATARSINIEYKF